MFIAYQNQQHKQKERMIDIEQKHITKVAMTMNTTGR
jgi:hypothetical protein